MTVNVFILGRTGCGKSAAARYITKFARERDWSTERVNDYPILRRMFLQDTQQAQFAPAKYGGFDIKDFSVLDLALKELEDQIRDIPVEPKKLLLIEFARADYEQAFLQMDFNILKDAYFLFIDANVDTCVQRVHERVKNQQTADDYYVSDKILRSYFNEQFMPDTIGANRVTFIKNRGSLLELVEKVYDFVDSILRQEAYLLEHQDIPGEDEEQNICELVAATSLAT